MKKRITIIAFILGMSATTYADVIDSLSVVLEYEKSPSNRMEVLFQLSRAHVTNGNYELASSYIDEGLMIARKKTNHRYLSDFYYLTGYCHEHANRLTDAYVAFKLSQNHQNLAENTVSYGKPDIYIGRHLMAIGEYVEAQSVYQNIEAALLERGNYLEVGRVHEHLGFLYRKLDNYDESILEFTLAASFFQKAKNKSLVAKCWAELGDELRIQNKLEEAKIYTSKAIDAFRELPDSALKITYAYHNMALIYLELNQADKALQYLLSSYESSKTVVADPNQKANIAATLANYWISNDRTDEAIEVLLPIAQNHSETPTKWELEALLMLSSLYEEQGNLAKALEMERKAKDGLVMHDKMIAARQEARQAADVQAAQAMLKALDSETRRREANTNWWIAAVIMVLVLGLISYYMYRRMVFYRKEAWRHATNWPELQKKMDALEQTLCVMD